MGGGGTPNLRYVCSELVHDNSQPKYIAHILARKNENFYVACEYFFSFFT